MAYGGVTLLGWLLGAAGLISLPPVGFVVIDLVLDALLFTGLLLFWRPAWILAVIATGAGEVGYALHGGRQALLYLIGIAQLVLLFMPPLRRSFR